MGLDAKNPLGDFRQSETQTSLDRTFLNFTCSKFRNDILQKTNNKGAGQTALIHPDIGAVWFLPLLIAFTRNRVSWVKAHVLRAKISLFGSIIDLIFHFISE